MQAATLTVMPAEQLAVTVPASAPVRRAMTVLVHLDELG
jgi:hypothetical protein